MSNTIGQFDHTVVQIAKAGDYPFTPFVNLTLKRWGQSADDGAPMISAQLMSEREIDEHIRDLKADLDAVGTRAKRALVKARESTLAKVSASIADRTT